MSRRKNIDEIQGHRTKAELQRRHAQEFGPGAFGLPPRVQGLDRVTRNLWNKWAKYLLDKRLLARTDGPALMAMVEAELIGDRERMEAIAATWRDREPFPESTEPPAPEESLPLGLTLADFLAAVQRERATFAARLIPGATVCLDSNDQPYLWPDTDAAAIARRYALEITQGSRVAGELMKRAADRFLKDLEVGHERGFFFDPVAARHICTFAETFCSLQLMPWEVWLLSCVFAFKKPTGARRFTEALISVAKKNGKTALGAVVGLWGLIADQVQFADVFVSATKKEQARLVWRDAKRMVGANEELRNHVSRYAGALQVPGTDSTMSALSSDIKSMDGTRGSTFICDELHMWADADQYSKLVKGGVSRVSPLAFCITTAGESKNTFCYGKFDLAEKILRGIFQDDTTFVAIWQIDKTDDSLTDETCWAKANPSLDNPEILRPEHLRKTRDEVLQQPSGLNAWLRYHMNLWSDSTLNRAGSIPATKWDLCAGLDLIAEQDPMKAAVKFLLLNRDTPCFGGLDVGLSSDLTCFVQLFPRGRFAANQELLEKKVLLAQFFMPEMGLLDKEKSWQVPLSTWVRQGFIQLLPGDMTDPREIRKYILEMASRFYVREVGFDDWNARVLCAEINESGAANCVAVPQTAKELTAPARELLTAINNKSLVHFANPCMAWMAGNVILAENERHGGTKPEKLSANEKIDGISATLNAWNRLLAAPPSSGGITFIFDDHAKRIDARTGAEQIYRG